MPSTLAPSDRPAGYAGTFNDGRTAARRDVIVALESDGLAISEPDGRPVATWAYGQLRRVDERSSSGAVRLRCAGDDARLTVADGRILGELTRRAQHLHAAPRARRVALRWTAVAIAGTLLVIGFLWAALPVLARAAANAMPVAWEEALGDRVFAGFTDGEPKFCDAAPGRAALDRLIDRLAVAAEGPYHFRVRVLDVEMANAFALPGGWIVLFRGLLGAAEGPEEVAGVLAHEIGHVTHRHATQAIMRNLGLEMVFGLLLGNLGQGVVGSLTEVLVQVSYSREAEDEADRTALALLTAAGLDPGGMARFFKRLAQAQRDLPDAFALLSTHPKPGSRARRFAAAPAATAGPAMPADDWRALREICG